MDALIAATAKTHGATLATRNISDFEHCGIPLVNPWERP
jgi:predicted nucleic acid-binding protein